MIPEPTRWMRSAIFIRSPPAPYRPGSRPARPGPRSAAFRSPAPRSPSASSPSRQHDRLAVPITSSPSGPQPLEHDDLLDESQLRDHDRGRPSDMAVCRGLRAEGTPARMSSRTRPSADDDLLRLEEDALGVRRRDDEHTVELADHDVARLHRDAADRRPAPGQRPSPSVRSRSAGRGHGRRPGSRSREGPRCRGGCRRGCSRRTLAASPSSP